MNDDPREFVFTRYEARHGMAWLAQAYALFSRKRLPWLLLLLTYYILLKLLLYAPYVGAYAISILKPVFAVGLLAAAWTQERGGTPQLGQLFLGFRSNLRSLLPIGIFFVVGVTAAVFASSLVDDGKLLDLLSNTGGTMKEEDVAAALADGSLQAAMLFSALLTIPVLIATWWAPALVVFQNAGAGTALAVSFRAAIANFRPLAVYVLGVFFFARRLAGALDRRAGAPAAGDGPADRQAAADSLWDTSRRHAAHLGLRQLPRRVPCGGNLAPLSGADSQHVG